MPDVVSLQYEVADIVGLDGWRIYEGAGKSSEGRHILPDHLAMELARVLIVEFLKGFIQADKLGQAAMAKLSELYEDFQNKKLGGSMDDGSFIHIFDNAQPVALQATPQELKGAEDDLAESLRRFGLSDEDAKAKASEIRASVMKSLDSES